MNWKFCVEWIWKEYRNQRRVANTFFHRTAQHQKKPQKAVKELLETFRTKASLIMQLETQVFGVEFYLVLYLIFLLQNSTLCFPPPPKKIQWFPLYEFPQHWAIDTKIKELKLPVCSFTSDKVMQANAESEKLNPIVWNQHPEWNNNPWNEACIVCVCAGSTIARHRQKKKKNQNKSDTGAPDGLTAV